MFTDREFHEVAKIFPEMGKEQFEDLKSDIKQNGLREPIWVDKDDLILDGRNRYRACKELQIIPEYRTYDKEGSLVTFVVSLNLKRRHLSSRQKAFLAVEINALLAEEAKYRKREAGELYGEGHPKGKKDISPLALVKSADELQEDPEKIPEALISKKKNSAENESRTKAAKLIGVNPHYVSDAVRIAKNAPEVAEAIVSGLTISIKNGTKISKLPESQRKEIIAKVSEGSKPSDAIRETVRKTITPTDNWTKGEIEKKKEVDSGIAVIANIKTEGLLIAWAESHNKYVRIDRLSIWENPFLLDQDGDRETIIEHYKQYLDWRPSLLKRLPELQGKVLGCCCCSDKCHGNILIDYLNHGLVSNRE